jgi:hypothetical protein
MTYLKMPYFEQVKRLKELTTLHHIERTLNTINAQKKDTSFNLQREGELPKSNHENEMRKCFSIYREGLASLTIQKST